MKKWEMILLRSIGTAIILITTFLMILYSINIISVLNNSNSMEYLEYHCLKDLIKVLLCVVFNILAGRLLRYVKDIELGERIYQDMLNKKEKEIEEKKISELEIENI